MCAHQLRLQTQKRLVTECQMFNVLILTKYDVVDEAIIDAEPSVVFQAMSDEVTGVSKWWMPHWEGKIRDNEKKVQVGSIIDIIIHKHGKQKVAAKCIEMIENKYAKFHYFEGAFIGIAEWNFEPINGKTKVRFRWNVVIKYSSLLGKLILRFINLGKVHSDVVQHGYRGLNRYVTQKKNQ